MKEPKKSLQSLLTVTRQAGMRGMGTGVEMGNGYPSGDHLIYHGHQSIDCSISLATTATMIAHTINHCLTLDYFLVVPIVTTAAHREVGRGGGK